MSTVTVGCKLPHGLVLELANGSEIALNGTNVNAKGRDFYVPPAEYGETEVDAALFEQWLKDHKDAPYVKNGFVFAAAKPADLKAKAKDGAKKTGLEPMSQTAPGIDKSE